MMDELKQQFYEVMHKYQKPFSEEGVTANLTQWSEQKQGLLQLLRRHPLWNEKELAIVFRVEERREIDRATVDETRAAILELGRRACTDDTVYENFETALRAATADCRRLCLRRIGAADVSMRGMNISTMTSGSTFLRRSE